MLTMNFTRYTAGAYQLPWYTVRCGGVVRRVQEPSIKDLCFLHERCSYRLSAVVLQLVCPSSGNAWLCFFLVGVRMVATWRLARFLVRVSAGVDAEPGSLRLR